MISELSSRGAEQMSRVSTLADHKFNLGQLNGMCLWEDAFDDCLLRYRDVLFHD
jgi:hypothetical protein